MSPPSLSGRDPEGFWGGAPTPWRAHLLPGLVQVLLQRVVSDHVLRVTDAPPSLLQGLHVQAHSTNVFPPTRDHVECPRAPLLSRLPSCPRAPVPPCPLSWAPTTA